MIDIAEGENLEVDPPRRLVQSFTALWSDEVKSAGASRVTWEIEQVEDSCQLTVTHDQLPEDANSELFGGWPMILSGLKTLLETGENADHAGLAALLGSLGIGRLSRAAAAGEGAPRPPRLPVSVETAGIEPASATASRRRLQA